MLTQTTSTPLECITRPIALLIVTSLVSPALFAGCGSNQQASAPPPRDASAGEMARINPGAAPTRQGMSTKKKLVLLAGAAALYYMYKRNQAKVAAGQSNVQYYLSKNGRIYYRDPKNPRQAIWVTPPRQGFSVPADEAMQYEGLQGYNGSNNGRDLTGLVPTAPSNF